MSMADQLWRDLKTLKQEILDLKQLKKANSVSRYYVYKVEMDADYHSDWKITYKDGSQPIVAEVLSDATNSLSTPSGNVQYLFTYGHMSSNITILSTREIESVEGLPWP